VRWLNVVKELRDRKANRIPGKNYNMNGAYFLTICVKDRDELLGEIHNDRMILSPVGEIVQDELRTIEAIYASVLVDSFVVMPNHVHILLCLLNSESNPSASRVVQQWKGAISKKAGFSLWQKNFHDHVVNTAEEFRKIQQYILNNPTNWKEDVLRPLAV